MALSRLSFWLRDRANALVNRCAAMMQRRRMRRAEALLPKTAREKASFWRTLYRAREARLQRERQARRQARGNSAVAAKDIGKADVLAAIARSRASREARLKARNDPEQR